MFQSLYKIVNKIVFIFEGKLAHGSGCWIPYGGGKEAKHTSYKVATGNATWVPYNNGENLGNLVSTGFSKTGTQIIVCRGNYNGCLLPGKLEGHACYVAAESAEHKLNDFEVLTQHCSEELSYYFSS